MKKTTLLLATLLGKTSMKYHINKSENYSLATIIPRQTPTVSALITVDVHDERTVADQSAQLMYGDAILSGTEKHTREEFLNAVNTLGATLSVNVGSGVVTFSLKSRKEHFGKLLSLFETMMISPLFSKAELQRIRTTVHNELIESKEDSKSIAQENLLNTIYGFSDRKYTYPIEETIECVKTTQARHIKALHSKVLSRNWTCSIAGNSTECEKLHKTVKRITNNFSCKDTTSIHQQKTPKQVAVLSNIPSRSNIDFSIGAPLPITLHHPDYIPLSLGLAVLGKWGGFSGRLMSTVRELEGLTYGIYAKLEGFSGTEQGYWRIITFFSPDKALQGLESTFREIKKLYNKGITKAELEKFKTVMNTSQVLLNDSIGGLLSDLHSYHYNGFSLDEMKEHKNRVNSLTLDEVNKAVKTYLNPNNLTISGAGPTKTVQKNIKDFIKSV